MTPPSTTVQATLRRTYRYRVYPPRAQAAALETQLAFCCDLYNAALQERRDAWRKGVRVGYHDQARELTQIRHEGMAPAMNSWTQIDVLMRLDRDRLRLQGVGQIKVKWHRDIPAEAYLKIETVVRSGGRWHVCFSLEVPRPAAATREPAEVGIDLGVAAFVATSSGELVPGPRAGRGAAARVARLQRIVARRKKRSNRRRKAVALLARAREHEREVRRDHRHKVARDLVRRFTFIAVEKLQITNMVGSARGTVEVPGRSVRQKAGLNRSQLDQAWGSFLTTLRSKAEEAGSVIVEVDPRNTSRTCHECGVVDPASRRSQAVFVCVACGHQANADVNAARNILGLGRSRQTPTVEDAPRAVA